MKSKILKRMNSNVTVVLRNGTEVKGRITQASENMFTIKENRSRHQRDISFADVTKLKSGGMSRGAKLGVLTGLISGTFLIGALMNLKTEPAGVR
jgi:small nuclear ribonucleoprotein (snRNP)-like protein